MNNKAAQPSTPSDMLTDKTKVVGQFSPEKPQVGISGGILNPVIPQLRKSITSKYYKKLWLF